MADQRGRRGSGRQGRTITKLGDGSSLTNRPLQGKFKGMRVGPACLVCGDVIDVRRQANGWVHTHCETKEGQPVPLLGVFKEGEELLLVRIESGQA